MDTEIIVATARGPDATAVSANVVLDERQMNALFLDLVSYSLLWFGLEQKNGTASLLQAKDNMG